MDFTIRKSKDSDAVEIAKIFNYYVNSGTAAFLDVPVDPKIFYGWLKDASCNDSVYTVENEGKIAGFGVLKQFYDHRVFKTTAEPGYFMLPGFTGNGAGGKLYDIIEKDARNLGIKILIVSISSKNERSIYFHSKRGFIECGRFRRVGNKNGTEFDMVWMQKFL